MESESWQCPFCGNHATVGKEDITLEKRYLHRDASHGWVYLQYCSIRCPNPECKDVSLGVTLLTYSGDSTGGQAEYLATPFENWRLRPESDAQPQPDSIPQSIRDDYYEACLIKDKSPKASATLSRRCLQAMIRDFWEVEGERNLYNEINAIEDKVQPEVWESINLIRTMGNIGAHMQGDVNLIVDVAPDEAGHLIELIEQLFEEWYVARDNRRKRAARSKIIAMKKELEEKAAKEAKASPAPEDGPE